MNSVDQIKTFKLIYKNQNFINDDKRLMSYSGCTLTNETETKELTKLNVYRLCYNNQKLHLLRFKATLCNTVLPCVILSIDKAKKVAFKYEDYCPIDQLDDNDESIRASIRQCMLVCHITDTLFDKRSSFLVKKTGKVISLSATVNPNRVKSIANVSLKDKWTDDRCLGFSSKDVRDFLDTWLDMSSGEYDENIPLIVFMFSMYLEEYIPQDELSHIRTLIKTNLANLLERINYGNCKD